GRWSPKHVKGIGIPTLREWLPVTGKESNLSPARNVFACLVHESQECVIDLVRNLRFADPSSVILLYNGGTNPQLLHRFPFESLGTVVYPSPKPMKWGRLHEFA